MINPYAVGKNIYLRSPTEEDANGNWYQWFSDEETTKMLDARFWPNTKQAQMEFYNSLHNDRSKMVLSVVLSSSDKHIGVVSLSAINWVHRYADVAIVIGDKEYNQGVYAMEAFSLILKVAFMRLNLLNIRAGYCESNKASQALQKIFKFKTVGVYENLMFVNGKAENGIVTYLDKESWMKRNS